MNGTDDIRKKLTEKYYNLCWTATQVCLSIDDVTPTLSHSLDFHYSAMNLTTSVESIYSDPQPGLGRCHNIPIIQAKPKKMTALAKSAPLVADKAKDRTKLLEPNTEMGPARKPCLIEDEASQHELPPMPSIYLDTLEACCIKREKQPVISNRPIYIEREAAMNEDSWYNTYVEMENKRERNALLKVDDISSFDEDNASEMLRTHTNSDLRANLYIVQQH
eukprot:4076525-Ditylum_brightwellii.AAC.1